MQDAYAIALGFGAVNNNEDLDYEWFEAIADDDLEAESMMLRTNAHRFANRVRMKRG